MVVSHTDEWSARCGPGRRRTHDGASLRHFLSAKLPMEWFSSPSMRLRQTACQLALWKLSASPSVPVINCFLRHPVWRLAATIPTVVSANPGRPAPRFLATGRRSRAAGLARPGIRDGPGHRQPTAGHGEVHDRDVTMSRRGDGVKRVGLPRHRALVLGDHGPGARTGSRGLSRQREAVSTQALLRGVAPPERCRGAVA